MRPGKAIFIFGLLMVASFFGFIPVVHAGGGITAQSFCARENQTGPTITCSATLNETTGDLIIIWTGSWHNSNTCSPDVTSVSDGGFNTFVLDATTGCVTPNTFSGNIVNLYSVTSTHTGAVTITVTYGGSQLTATIMGFDFSGVPNSNTFKSAQTGVGVETKNPQTVSLNGNVPGATGDLFIEFGAGACGASSTCGPTTPPFDCNDITGVTNCWNLYFFYQNSLGGDITGFTNMPFTLGGNAAGNPNTIAFIGAEFGFGVSTIVIPCNFFQVQCWMYPLLMMSLVGGLMFAAVEPSRPSKEAITYILLASFTFTSAVEVLMGLLPITMPLLLTVIMVVYAWRFR